MKILENICGIIIDETRQTCFLGSRAWKSKATEHKEQSKWGEVPTEEIWVEPTVLQHIH